jgi:hypothetical protein
MLNVCPILYAFKHLVHVLNVGQLNAKKLTNALKALVRTLNVQSVQRVINVRRSRENVAVQRFAFQIAKNVKKSPIKNVNANKGLAGHVKWIWKIGLAGNALVTRAPPNMNVSHAPKAFFQRQDH